MKMPFDEWMQHVAWHINNMSGYLPDDLPDYCYRDAYDDGKSPKTTAKAAIKNAKEYF